MASACFIGLLPIARKGSTCVCDHAIRPALAPSLFYDPLRRWPRRRPVRPSQAGSGDLAHCVSLVSKALLGHSGLMRCSRPGAGLRLESTMCASSRATAGAGGGGGGGGFCRCVCWGRGQRRRRGGPHAPRSRTAPRVSALCASSRATAGAGGGSFGRWAGRGVANPHRVPCGAGSSSSSLLLQQQCHHHHRRHHYLQSSTTCSSTSTSSIGGVGAGRGSGSEGQGDACISPLALARPARPSARPRRTLGCKVFQVKTRGGGGSARFTVLAAVRPNNACASPSLLLRACCFRRKICTSELADGPSCYANTKKLSEHKQN